MHKLIKFKLKQLSELEIILKELHTTNQYQYLFDQWDNIGLGYSFPMVKVLARSGTVGTENPESQKKKSYKLRKTD